MPYRRCCNLVARDIHSLTKLAGLCAWCITSLRFEIPAQTFLNSLFAATDFVRTITHDHLRSPTTSAINRAISLRSSHDSNIFRSQLGRNMVVSPTHIKKSISCKDIYARLLQRLFSSGNMQCELEPESKMNGWSKLLLAVGLYACHTISVIDDPVSS